MEKEYLSEWFIEGLKEIGITEQEYHKKTQKEKKKYLEVLGHN